MKKALALMIALIMMLSLASCGKTKEENELDKANEELARSRQAADDARENYEALKRDVDDYKQSVDRLKSAQ